MKSFVVILNIIAAVIMFGLIALVPYVDFAHLSIEIYRMEEKGVFNQNQLDSYMNESNEITDRKNISYDLAHHLYRKASLARPFLSGAFFAFLANAICIGVFWNRHPKKEDHSSST